MDIKLSKIKVELPNTGKVLFRIPEYSIPPGSNLLIYGSSGKGKSTLLHMIAGLFVPTEGYIQVGENELTRLSDEDRSRLRRKHFGIVFQKLNLLDYLTAEENVRLGMGKTGSSGNMAQTARDVLKKVHLEAQADTLSSFLSLGEQQRVAVARVLAAKPDILLADEPTSSLDDKNSNAVLDLLFTASSGKTLIVVSHDHRIRERFKNSIDFERLIRQ